MTVYAFWLIVKVKTSDIGRMTSAYKTLRWVNVHSSIGLNMQGEYALQYNWFGMDQTQSINASPIQERYQIHEKCDFDQTEHFVYYYKRLT